MNEPLASKLLIRAGELESNSKFTEALVCYQESLDLLLNSLKTCADDNKRIALRKCFLTHVEKAEKLKVKIELKKEAGTYNEQINIAENAVGYSYDKLFGRFIDETVTWVKIQDPYIRQNHQICNFLRFCELIYKRSASNLRNIDLITSQNEDNIMQKENLNKIKMGLRKYNLNLNITFENSIHDREIILENGWIIKIGRGLDYYKPVDKFHLGHYDFDLRPCHATIVNVLHTNTIKIKK